MRLAILLDDVDTLRQVGDTVADPYTIDVVDALGCIGSRCCSNVSNACSNTAILVAYHYLSDTLGIFLRT